jgi:penicillin amidase
MKVLHTSLIVAAVLLALLAVLAAVGCRLLAPLPGPSSLHDRLAAFPAGPWPVRERVTIHWDEHQIPWIEAESDEDLAFALGLVQAHLRLAQMEMLRRVSQGRLAEMFGPPMARIDHALRILDFGKAADRIEREMPEATHRWLTRYVEGVNAYLATAKDLPQEFTVLNLPREPWSVRDVIVLGRLYASDVNWIMFFELMPLRGRPGWDRFWPRLSKNGGASTPSFRAPDDEAFLYDLLGGHSRSGSNSVVVAPGRSETGAALIANDTHVGITLPNLWLVAGVRSPSMHCVGLMFPGAPAFPIGRNEHVAWGGTNMRSASSELVDISGLAPEKLTSHTERIGVRFWLDRTVTVRESPFGPVITDAPVLKDWNTPPLALQWVGHQPSDEFTAFLRVARARNAEEFRRAFETYAVSGQNMLFADADGHVGQVLAVKVPVRTFTTLADLYVAPEAGRGPWNGFVGALELPCEMDPPDGFLVSANNLPLRTDPPLGFFFSSDDRVLRLRQILTGQTRVSVRDLMALQRDVYSIHSAAVRDLFVARLKELRESEPGTDRAVLEALQGWDGRYAADSRGALAFQLFLYHFVDAYCAERYGAAFRRFFLHSDYAYEFILQDLPEDRSPAALQALRAARRAASEDIARFRDWGAIHRVAPDHPLQNLPLVGRRYRVADHPAPGSTSTIQKTSHRFTNQRHETSYGATARHISDLSDPDENYFVLLGGQDGWLRSDTALDQIALWREGRYIRVPLRPESVRRTFPHETRLEPLPE